jgi:spore coat protein U-like protein
MRKVLLATAALSIFGVSSALAVGPQTQDVEITATVDASCSMNTDTADVNFGANPAVNTTIAGNALTFTCNFAGTNGTTLVVKFHSLHGGLNNPLDADSSRQYDVTYNGSGGPVVLHSDTDLHPGTFPVPETATFGANPRTFDVKLIQSLDYAGSYADTLTISVAP